jgi:hypothetical protein
MNVVKRQTSKSVQRKQKDVHYGPKISALKIMNDQFIMIK